MSDPMETRSIAKNWREHLAETADSVRVFAWVWRELIGRPSKVWARRMVLVAVVATAFNMAQPWLVKWVFDGLVGRDGRLVIVGLVGFAVCLLVRQFFSYLQMTFREHLIGENLTQLEGRMSELFFEKSLGQHLRDNNVLSASNVEKGRGKVQGVMEMLLFNGITAILDLAMTFVFLWVLSPFAGLVMTAVLAHYFVWTVYLNRRCVEVCTPIDAAFRKLNRYRCERWDKIERVKTCGKEAEETAEIYESNRRVFADDRRFWIWFIRMISVRSCIEMLALALIMAYGAWRAWEGVWTVGFLYPLFSWGRLFTQNVWSLGQIEQQFNWALPAVKSMKEALTAPPDVVDRPDAIDLPAEAAPRVELDAVGHAYAGSSEEGAAPAADKPSLPVLDDVSFAVEPGEKVALLGSSGVGKTTIMRLLQRYMDPERGSIRLDGRDLREYRLASWTKALAYIAQQPQVLDGTVRSNLLYGLTPEERAKVTDAELWELMKRLRIDFGDRINEGLDTKVGRNGIKLSGGESQRLLIGAAAMRHPRFMIIDEATSSLDSTTEKEVQRGLAEVLSGDMGALIIAHRLSTVRRLCTKFVVLASGEPGAGGARVEAVGGSFEELYRLSPTFRRLAEDQDIVIEGA